MNCKEWVECMTPEQTGILIGAVVTFVIAVIGAGVAIWQWLPKYIARLADERFKDREHKRNIEDKLTETELQNKRTETEVEAQQALALPEAFDKIITIFSQSQERHTKVDERYADTAEKRLELDRQKIESDNRLASAIDTLTRSSNTSQLWQESRANDFIDTANLINERVGGLERVGKSVIDSMTKIEVDLSEVRNKLNRIIEAHPTFAQQNTLLAIESGLASVKLMLESLVPKAPDLGNRQPIEADVLKKLDDTLKLSDEELLAVTKELPPALETSATVTPINQSQESNDNIPPLEKSA